MPSQKLTPSHDRGVHGITGSMDSRRGRVPVGVQHCSQSDFREGGEVPSADLVSRSTGHVNGSDC